MDNLYAKKICQKGKLICKIYDNINVNELHNYLHKLTENKIKIAKIVKITQKNIKKVEIEQKFVSGRTINDFVFFDSLIHKKLSKNSYIIFKKIIKMYFKKIFCLKEIAVDCKLSNFMIKGLTLVDIVPPLFIQDYNENDNSFFYGCYNKDIQIKWIICYYLKYYIMYSYSSNENPLQTLKIDFLKITNYVKKFYNLKLSQNQNEIEKKLSKRFEILCNINSFDSYDEFLKKFIEERFDKVTSFEVTSNVNLSKIYLIGGSGLGKTYTTKLIEKKINTKIINLDDIYWSRNFSVSNDIETIKSKIIESTSNLKNYIVEGSYLNNWTFEIAEKCDKIFIIKSNYKLQKTRIILRFLKRKFGIEKCNAKESVKSIRQLINWTKFYEEKLNKYIQIASERFNKKIQVVDSTDEILKEILMK